MEPNRSAREDQFLGAILGFAIGDALGRPFSGMSPAEIGASGARLDIYASDGDDPGNEVPGEITGISEVMLCLVESITTNGGMIDPENINARLLYLVNGPAREWLADGTIAGIELAGGRDGLVEVTGAGDSTLEVALRGVPVGLLHAIGGYDPEIMRQDAGLAARLSHGAAAQAEAVGLVATLVQDAARAREVPQTPRQASGKDVAVTISRVVTAISGAGTYEDGVAQAIRLGGATNQVGALAGAILGAAGVASVIPQHLIDGLDARIYLSLAAPWFFRAAQRRAGTVIDLRVIDPGA